MRSFWFKQTQRLKKQLQEHWYFLSDRIQQFWFKTMLLFMVIFVLLNKDLSFQLDLNTSPAIAMAGNGDYLTSSASPQLNQSALSLDFLSSLIPLQVVEKTTFIPSKNKDAKSQNLSNTYSNMDYGNEKNVSTTFNKSTQLKRQKQETYVKRFANVAQTEMKRYGIPASIKLAQGLIESNAGDSRLSQKNNNHFGMKCFSKKCKKGHCSNFTDDSHKDFFRVYSSAWDSYRAHSIMLTGKRYRHLRNFGKDYKAWAKGLKKAGYATDKKYAEKLIHLIERLELYRFD